MPLVGDTFQRLNANYSIFFIKIKKVEHSLTTHPQFKEFQCMDCIMYFSEHSKYEVYEVNHGSLMPSGAHYILIIPTSVCNALWDTLYMNYPHSSV